jgi:hypothetical protein
MRWFFDTLIRLRLVLLQTGLRYAYGVTVVVGRTQCHHQNQSQNKSSRRQKPNQQS